MKSGQNDKQKLLFEKCNELDIYYLKEVFVFKTFYASSIKKYIKLITFKNEPSGTNCKATEKLIFRQGTRVLFEAEISTEKTKDSVSCNIVRYQLGSKEYAHRLTYQAEMGIDEIYWHKIDPGGNPWIGFDTTKFHYEDLRN